MLKKNTISICSKFCRTHSEINAIMLVCTGIQPFAKAIRQAIDMPVFSRGTLLDYAYSVVYGALSCPELQDAHYSHTPRICRDIQNIPG